MVGYEKKWSTFLDKLRNSKEEYDAALLKYLEALKYVSEIKTDSIDDTEERNRINLKLQDITLFIEKYKDEYYEIGLIQGFRTNDNSKITGGDYYYYIADQKMKASVYYARYLNFIDRTSGSDKEILENVPKWLKEINNRLEEELRVSENAGEIDKQIPGIIEAIDNYLPGDSDALEIRQKCYELQFRLESEKNIEYKKYMMFNNMMREIRYVGAAYQYLWHWETKKKNLFRNVSPLSEDMKAECGRTKEKFLSDMFKEVIGHMNKSSGVLCSYSEDPFVDIYKYLKIEKKKEDSRPEGEYDVDKDGIKIRIVKLDNPNIATFEIIKSVMVNSVKRGDGQTTDFYSFIQDGRELGSTEKLAYAVEIFPDLKEAEKNSKNTTKNIKSLLVTYLKSWDPEGTKNLMSYVADDKEVVTYGAIESKEYDINLNHGLPEEYVEGCKYTMKLDKDAIIYLLLALQNINVSSLVKKIKFDFVYNKYTMPLKVKEALGKLLSTEIQDTKIKDAIQMKITPNVIVEINFEAVISAGYFKRISEVNGEKITIEGAVKKIRENMEGLLQSFFEGRYRKIFDSGKAGKYAGADFIIAFIQKEGYASPSYIGDYNEFESFKNDEEISLLKHLIFKER